MRREHQQSIETGTSWDTGTAVQTMAVALSLPGGGAVVVVIRIGRKEIT